MIPPPTNFSGFSPTYVTVFLGVLALPVLIYLAGRPRAGSLTAPVWDGGIVAFKPRLQYSAMTFSAPTRVTFEALYRPSASVRRASDDPAGRSGAVHYESQVTPVFDRCLYRPVIRVFECLADVVRLIQSGDVNLCLFTCSRPSWTHSWWARRDEPRPVRHAHLAAISSRSAAHQPGLVPGAPCTPGVAVLIRAASQDLGNRLVQRYITPV